MEPEEWPTIPLDEDALAVGAVIDARLKAERQNREVIVEPPQPVALSFACGNIAVTSCLGARRIAHAYDQVVSLGTLEDFPLDLFPGHPSCLRMPFDDVTEATQEELRLGVRLPSKDDIQGVLSFAGRGKSILVHCRAGISRSPAMAILVAWNMGYSIEELLSGMDVNKVYPNKLILSLGEEVLGLEAGFLVNAVFTRLAGRPKPNPPLPIFRVDEDGVYRLAH